MRGLAKPPNGISVNFCGGHARRTIATLNEDRPDEKADQDLGRIYEYLAERSPRAADATFQRINEKFENLAHFPFMGRARSTFGADVRSVVVSRYVIFHIVGDEAVIVLRVIDGRMDIDEEFKR